MIWTHLKYRNFGLLFLRVTLGLYLAFGHGWSKIAGGPGFWAKHGQTMEMFGLGFLPSFWGFMSGFAEFFCALAVVVGLLTRPAALLVVINMLVAATGHMTGAIDGGPEMSLMYGFVFLSLILIGPGAYSVDEQLGG